MSEKVQEALISLLSVLCGAIIGASSSIFALIYTIWHDRLQRKEERRLHNIQKIEAYIDARISKIKSLANPPININTLIEYLQAELWREAGSSEAARASARLLGDKELSTYLGELENIFLKIWDSQKEAAQQQDLPELEKMATDLYHKCAERVESLKKAS
jgi:hypothetical protein